MSLPAAPANLTVKSAGWEQQPYLVQAIAQAASYYMKGSLRQAASCDTQLASHKNTIPTKVEGW